MSALLHSTRTQAPVFEVFASIQGEGAYVGEPQSFVRLRGCPLRCRWCDTPASWTLVAEPQARIDAVRGTRREAAWATPFQVACWIAEVEPGAPRTLSITGGEPLLWPAFITELRRFVGTRRVHLETAGAHPRALERVLDAVDHISLDLKLAADLDAPVELTEVDPSAAGAAHAASEAAPRTRVEWAEARARCLQLVAERDACAKLIVAGGRAPREFDELLESVAEHAPRVPVIVQPVTPCNSIAAPSEELLVALVERARELDLVVRVVPQVHKLLGVP